jgi:hypothetical protein
VRALLGLGNGDLVAGGTFATAGGIAANCIARWNGGAWNALGNGIDPTLPFGSAVQALAALPNGDLVAGGSFAAASGVPAANVARWNGTSWSALGSGCNNTVKALAVLPNGDLIATGAFTTAGGVLCNGIARWSGGAWSALGTGLGVFGGTSLAVLPNGDLVVGGTFVTAGGAAANRIARWNGAWSALGTGLNGAATSLCTLANGDVLAGGQFTTAGGAAANNVAKWNGAAWAPLAGGTNGTVNELVQLATGAVVAAGEFTSANGAAAGRIARIDSSCAPTGAVLGAGCSGSGGLNVLAATSLPLLGGTFRAFGTGMPPIGLVLSVTGLSATSLPLNLALPQALPGCTLYASPDLIDVLIPVAGTASSALVFPNNPAILGVQLFHQYVPLELDLAFNITAVTASNALQLTVGSF